MAMSVTYEHQSNRVIKWVSFTWTSAADGTATGSTTEKISGKILRLVTNPGAAAPTDNYDITVTDDNALDVLQGLGANRHTTSTQEANIIYAATSLNPVVDSALTLNISNAGDSKNGVVIVYYEGQREG